MARSNDRGQEIAEQVRAGTLSPDEALQAVAVEAAQAVGAGEDLLEEDDFDEEQRAHAEREQQAAADAKRQRVRALGHRLGGLAKQQVQLRQETEERWYKDVRQFNGQYDPDMFPEAEDGEVPYGSRVYVPLTRRLVTVCEARLYDMLFQAGERGFILKPTPVPEFDRAEQLAEQLPDDHPVDVAGQPVQVSKIAETIKAMVDKAQQAADGMQREIDDQLAECKYSTHARNVIHDACLLGTGVLKGPHVLYKTSKRWDVDEATGNATLTMDRRPVPVALRVDPWNFFPDMSATTIDEAEFVFERHFLTKKELAALKDMEAVDLDALREILGAEPTAVAGSHRERLRAINGATGAPDKRYEVWEYHGPLTAEDLCDCGVEVENMDPLVQYTGIVWFCQNVVIKAALNPLDSGELPYRVFTWQKDESNIFGFGIPYEVRDGQEAANSSFRAGLDSMGLAAKPQVFIDDTQVEPQNGRWDIEPGKFWRNKNGKPVKGSGFEVVELNSRISEFLAVFRESKMLVEEVGTLPAWLQGQDAPAAMQSATGSSIAWTAANLWVRRCVRNWDDDVVTPTIGGFFDWNMQYSPKKEIKGDSQVQALGISALAELEGVAQRMKEFITTAKAMGVPLSSQLLMLRQFARSFKLDPDLVLPSEAEIEKMKQNEKPPLSPEESRLEVAKMQSDDRAREYAQRDKDNQVRIGLTLATLASNERITKEEAAQKYGLDKFESMLELQDHREQRAHEAQTTNAELQSRYQTGAGV
jgi:hypothetical protein